MAKPLEYGNIVKYYENYPRCPKMLAGIFSAVYAPCSAEDVKAMRPGVPALLEYGALVVSDLLESDRMEAAQGDRISRSNDEADDVVRSDSMFTAHQPKQKRRNDVDTDLADFLYGYVGNYGSPPMDVYQLTIGEIDAIRFGHERAEKKSKKNSGVNSGSAGSGNQKDAIGSRRNLPDSHAG